MNRRLALVLPLLLAAVPAAAQRSTLDAPAIDYVRLSLEIGEHEEGYIDAYYGPPELKEAAKANKRDLPALSKAVAELQGRIAAVPAAGLQPIEQKRRAFLLGQLKAAETRLAMMQGRKFKFVDEAEGLFGYRPELKPLSHYDAVIAKLEAALPGAQPLPWRIAAYKKPGVVPAAKLEPVIRAAIDECRARTLKHLALPANEKFVLEFVTKQPWSGYNWYKGNAQSLIQVNTDNPVTFSHAVDLGCHEGYPGHHAYNARLEEKLARGRGWIEFTVYPLYSPQSFIAEGSANAGIKLAFPGDEQRRFEAEKLHPIAGVPFDEPEERPEIDALLEDLSGASLTITAMYLDGEVDRAGAAKLFGKYGGGGGGFGFIDKYRSYVINYSLGEQLVAHALDAGNPDEAERWRRMERILSEPVLPTDLVAATGPTGVKAR